MSFSLFWDVTQVWKVATAVSKEPVGPIFKVEAIQKDFLTVEDGADRMSRNVSN